MKLTFLTYANSEFEKTRNQLCQRILAIEGRDTQLISKRPKDIGKEFLHENSEILSIKRGNGLWIWKPYFIYNSLKKDIRENEYLIYLDSGFKPIKSIKPLIDEMSNSDYDIILTTNNTINIQFIKREVLEAFHLEKDQDFLLNRCLNAGILIIKNSLSSRKFILDWLRVCTNKNLISSSYSKNKQFKDFIAHREDQSLLSVLAYKNFGNIKIIDDITNYRNETMGYYRINIILRPYSKDFKKVYFLLHRRERYLPFKIKYHIKKFLLKKVWNNG